MSALFFPRPAPTSTYNIPSTLGLGKAPRIRSRFHTAKPYARSPSTQRAKKSHKTTSQIHILQSIRAQSRRARSILGKVRSEEKENVKGSGRELELIKGMKSMGVETPTKLSGGVPMKSEGAGFVYIPTGGLQRRVLPPIPNIVANGQDIPAVYIRSKFSPLFPEYLIISNMYRPYLQYSLPSPSPRKTTTPLPSRHLDDQFSEIAMGVPAVVDAASRGFEHPWVRKMYGRSPDGILNVREIGKEGEKGVVFPVNVVVYMSQCAFWHEILEKGRRTRWAGEAQAGGAGTFEESTSSLGSSSAVSVVSDASDHTVVAEESDDKPTFKLEPPSPLRPSSPISIPQTHPAELHTADDESTYLTESTTSTSSTLLNTPPGTSLHLLHLPLLPIYIPHLPTFNSLHLYLHQPSTNPLPHILQLDPHLCINTETLEPHLHTLPIVHLVGMMKRVEGFWNNCLILGVGDERIWGWSEYAWGILQWVVKKRSRKVEASGEGCFRWEDYYQGQKA